LRIEDFQGKANYVNIFLIFEIAIFSHQVLSN